MPAPSDRSVSQWIADLQDNQDSIAHQELWQRYFTRLVGLARAKLGNSPRGAEDEEDVALSALDSFFGGLQEGQFPELKDRNGLWPLLAKITSRKAINQRKRQMAAKRGGGRVIATSAAGRDSDGEPMAMDFAEDEPSPGSLVAISEECQRLIDILPEQPLQEIAQLKLAGYTTVEIAKEMGVAPRTVERKTGLIRKYWIQDADEEDATDEAAKQGEA